MGHGPPTHLRLVEPLGAGGSGEVWLARDRRAGRDVALKLVPLDELGRGAERLAREARALTRLAGESGVPALHEVGNDGHDQGWISVELVPGPTLEQATAHTPLEGPDAAALLAALARTLAAAHAVGVVHGDVTPANVVLHPDRGPVLVDWGLAEVGDAGPPRPAALTPAYAAPERRRGMPPGPPGDVYGAAATVLAALGRPPDGAALVAPVPAEVADPPAAALRRALALDPRRRPSAAELAVLVAERPSAGAQPARPRRFRRPWSGWGRAAGRR